MAVLLYFIPQLFCCHVALCLNFALFAALPLLVYSFDSAKVKLICNICACQVYYFAVIVDGVDLMISSMVNRKILCKTSSCIDASSCPIWLNYADTDNFSNRSNFTTNCNCLTFAYSKISTCLQIIICKCPIEISTCSPAKLSTSPSTTVYPSIGRTSLNTMPVLT